MGTWGAGIFSDDAACDVRDQFHELHCAGLETREVVKRLLEEYTSNTDIAEERAVFWMALAATAWKCGRLTPDIKSRALAAIDKGADLAIWQEEAPKMVKKRLGAIEALRSKLMSSQRAPTTIRKRYIHDFGWRKGDAIAFELRSGKTAYFRVLAIDRLGSHEIPILDIADIRVRNIPRPATIARAPRRRSTRFKLNLEFAAHDPKIVKYLVATDGKFMLRARSAAEVPNQRLKRIATGMALPKSNRQGGFVLDCSDLDESLKELFRLG